MSLLEKLHEWLTIRKVAAILLLLGVIPVLVPLGLPLPVSSYTKDFVSVVEGLPDGSVIGYMFDAPTESYGRLGSAVLSINELFIRHKFKLIICTDYVDAPVLIEDMVKKSGFEAKGYKYGTDYVIMPYLPGLESALAAIASSFGEVFSRDYYGTPVSQLELVKDLKRIVDRAKVIFFYSDSYDDPGYLTRQFGVPYNIPLIGLAQWGTCSAFYPAYIKGVINQAQGAAELEYYRGLAPRNTAITDARNLVDYAWIGLMILGNIMWFKVEKRKELKAIS